MIAFDGAFGVVMLGLWLFCILDVITTDQSRIRNLPKLAWLFIVILIPDIGSIAWLIAGHTWEPRPAAPSRTQSRFPEYDRPGRHIAANPDETRPSCVRCGPAPKNSAGAARPAGPPPGIHRTAAADRSRLSFDPDSPERSGRRRSTAAENQPSLLSGTS